MNKILEALSASLGEFINRSFITAGLVPAIVLMAGWSLYRNGWGDTRETVELALSSGEQFLMTVGWWALVIILIAWIFVVLRNVIQFVLADVPIWFAGELLAGVQHRRHDAIQDDVTAWLRRYEALRWQESGKPFEEICHEDLKNPAVDIQALRACAAETKALLGQPSLLQKRRARKLGDLLRPVWLASRWPNRGQVPKEISELLEALRRFVGENTAYLRRLENATAVAAREVDVAKAQRDRYPQDPKWLRPTRFGNRLAALDDYAESRYGIDTSTAWIRLWSVLSEEERTEFRNADQSVSALANTAAALMAVAAVVLVTELAQWTHFFNAARIDWRALLYLLGFATLAYAAYSGAVFALGALKDVVSRSIDVNRLELLKALGFERPRTVAQENAMFRELRGFFAGQRSRSEWRKLTTDTEKS